MSVSQIASARKLNRVVIYARVATDDQDGGALKRQLAALRDACATDERIIVAEFSDIESGHVPFRQRPGGRQIIEAAAAGQFDELVIESPSRLGRSSPILKSAYASLKRLGVSVRLVAELSSTVDRVGLFERWG